MKKVNQVWANDLAERLNSTVHYMKAYGIIRKAIEDQLDEGLITTYPPEIAIEHLKSVLDFRDVDLDEIISYTDDEQDKSCLIHLTIPIQTNKEVKEKIVEKANQVFIMSGYVLALETIMNYEGVIVYHYEYEPNWVKPERKHWNGVPILYHMTASIWKDKIERIGLVPTGKNKDFNYSGRIYFMRPYKDEDNTFELLKFVWKSKLQNLKDLPKSIIAKPVFFVLDTSKFPEDTTFYHDPMMGHSFYVKQNIRPELLRYDEELTERFISYLEKHEDD